MKYEITDDFDKILKFNDENEAVKVQELLSDHYHNNTFHVEQYENSYVIEVMDDDYSLQGNVSSVDFGDLK